MGFVDSLTQTIVRSMNIEGRGSLKMILDKSFKNLIFICIRLTFMILFAICRSSGLLLWSNLLNLWLSSSLKGAVFRGGRAGRKKIEYYLKRNYSMVSIISHVSIISTVWEKLQMTLLNVQYNLMLKRSYFFILVLFTI